MARPKKNAAAATKAVKTKETAKAEAKAVEVKAAEKVETAAKAETAAEEAAEVVKTVEKEAKKAPAKKAAVKEEFFLQFGGSEISQSDIMKKVKENWTKVQKKKIKDIKTISVYLVPENGCAYYAVNGEGSDDYKVEL